MVGLRGVPAAYSGIERHVEEIGARLVSAGHEITVFCHAVPGGVRPREYKGMRLRYVPAIRTKHLETITHTALSVLTTIVGRYEVVHFHALGPGALAPIPKYASTARVVQTIHGLDADRAKWGAPARRALKAAEWMSARTPDMTITVSETLRDHYRHQHHRETVCIPNGVTPLTWDGAQPETPLPNGLEDGGYVLFVGRLVPEKAPDVLISAYKRLSTRRPLVIVGGSSHTDRYVQELEQLAAGDPRVTLTGPMYGAALDRLYANAGLFVSPSMLEAGPPITMLEAIAHGLPVLGSDIPAQVEALGDGGPGRRTFTAGATESLVVTLQQALSDLDGERAMAAQWRESVLAAHSWDAAARATAEVYESVLRPVTGRRARRRGDD